MMLSRPKPGESEVDLLRFQSQFLEAGAAPAVQLVKGSRRHGDAHPDQLPVQDRRDVVMLDNLPDLPPALVPAPAKRARPSPCHPLPHDEDPEERLRTRYKFSRCDSACAQWRCFPSCVPSLTGETGEIGSTQ